MIDISRLRTLAPLARRILLLLAVPVAATAADWRISTFAGTGIAGSTGDGGPALAAQINDPYGIVRGPDGAIWFCEHNGHRIRRIAPDGTITTIVGTGEKGYSGDGGPAIAATLNLPHEIRFDRAGHLFIADMGNNAIRRVDLKAGTITTIAGGPSRRGYSGDGGPAASAALNAPHSIQFDSTGKLYICDVSNHAIRVVEPVTGVITTFAGTGKPGPTPDGSPISGTPLNNPRSLDVDGDGNPWLVTREGNQVLKFDLKAGVIRHIAGTGASGFTGNGGPAKLATLSGPKGIALDAGGNAWLADTESHSIRMINAASGKLELMVGTGVKGDGPDGDPLRSALNRVHGVFVDKDGSVFIGDSEANRIRVLRDGVVPPPPLTLPRTEVISLLSRTGLPYRISIALPRSYAANAKGSYPVIYLLDSDYSFAVVRNMVEHLADRDGLPEAVIVGVGYPDGIEGPDWKRRYRLQRTRDYTPTHSLKGYPEGVQEVSGGGAAFLSFLETELLPLVDRRYRTRPADRALVGHSYGGLFALYAALTKPELFSRIVSISPSLWYDDRWLAPYEASHREQRKGSAARLFIAAGALEADTEQNIAGDATRFASLLGKQGMDVTFRLFDEENHDSIFPAAVTRGLRVVFGR